MAAVAAARGQAAFGAALGGFAAAFVLAASSNLLQQAAATGAIDAVDTRWLLRLAEIGTVVFAVTLPASLAVRPRRGDWLAGVAALVIMSAVFLGEPATARFLLLWNQGLTGAFPGTVYALALGAAVVAISALGRQRRGLEAAAIVLLVAGGVGLHSTYQSGLVVIALGFLALAPRIESPFTRAAD
jgi:hypothetical protein